MSVLFAQGDATRLPLESQSVDLVVGSPPYADARLYLEDGRDLGISRDQFEWVDWMLAVTAEALRVTRGAVIWVCAGVTRDRNYWPCCEGLLWEAHKRGWLSERPVYWHRVGIPGSGGDQWFRADVEYCLAFKRAEKFPWSDNTACGHPPKWAPGGAMSNRMASGKRVNAFGVGGKKMNGRRADGSAATREKAFSVSSRNPDAVANPGNYLEVADDQSSSVIRVQAGGGRLGHPIAHENEAPYPEAVPEFFIKSLCPPGGIVCDPFSGSGTTAATAERLGRRAVGFDLRLSQCRLGRRRVDRPHAPVVRASAADVALPLFRDG